MKLSAVLFLVFLLTPVRPAWAQVVPLPVYLQNSDGVDQNTPPVAVCSTTWQQVVAKKRLGAILTVPASAGVALRFHFQDTGKDCSALTGLRGRRITAGNGFEFLTMQDGFQGQICARLESGSTCVEVERELW